METNEDRAPTFHFADPWRSVFYWRKRLQDCSNYPALDGLEMRWQELEHRFADSNRREDLPRTSAHPLSALFYYVEAGFYPPPELLLALLDAWEVYLAARGEISLDEAFFGPAKKKAGNYSRQAASRLQKYVLSMQMHSLRRQGFSKLKAAEKISETLGGRMEPETIARITRPIQRKRSQAK